MKDLKFDGMIELQDAEVMVVNGGGWFLPALLFQTMTEVIMGDFFSDIEKGYNEIR